MCRRPEIVTNGRAWVQRLLLIVVLLTVGGETARAQLYDPRLSFEQLETTHFRIYAPPEGRAMARRVAGLAEKAHDLLVPWMQHAPSTPTHVVVLDAFDDANGWAEAIPRPRMELRAVPPDARSELATYEDWLWQLVVHEYTHVLHLDTVGGLPDLGNRLFGRQFSPHSAWPRWFTEGLAVWAESELSVGGRRRSAVQQAALRALALEQRFPSLGVLSGPPLQWPRRGNWYLVGGAFVGALVDRQSPDGLARLLTDAGDEVWPFHPPGNFEQSWGIDLDEAYAEWTRSEMRAARAYVSTLSHRTLWDRRTTGGEARRSPRTTWDGSAVYSARVDGVGGPRLMRWDVSTERESEVWDLDGEASLAPLPEGGLLISQPEPSGPYAGRDDLWRWTEKDGGRRLTWGARLSSPDVAADGKVVAVWRPGYGRTAIVWAASVERLTVGDFHVLYEDPEGQPVDQPRWAPDSDTVVFAAHRGRSYDLRGGTVSQGTTEWWTASSAQELTPAFGASAQEVVFAADRDGTLDLYRLDRATSRVVRLTESDTGAWEPFSVAGRWGALTMTAGGWELAFPDREGTTPVEVAEPTLSTASNSVPSASSLDRDGPIPKPYRPWPTAWPIGWFPVQTADAWGRAWGATVWGADVLERLTYQVTGWFGTTSGQWGGEATVRVQSVWPMLVIRAGRNASLLPTARDASVTEVSTSAQIGVERPWRWAWQSLRLEGGLGGTLVDRPAVASFMEPTRIRPLSPPGLGTYLYGGFGYVWGRGAPLSIGMEKGVRFTTSIQTGGPWLASRWSETRMSGLLGGALPLWRRREQAPRPVIQARIQGFRTWGGRSGQSLVTVGGLSPGGLGPIGWAGANVLEVRGAPAQAVRGDRGVVSSVEVAMPLARLDWAWSTWPASVRRLQGLVFSDVGYVGRDDGATWLAGGGAELRWELILGYSLQSMARVGVARDLASTGAGWTAFVGWGSDG